MTKEQEDSIEILENTELDINTIYNVDLYIYNIAVKNVLSMLEEKDKVIDLMAEYIEDELTVDEFCTKEGCYADNYINGHCEKCLNCIKQYFENKAKEVEQ